jgi:hypothetical protein
VILGARHCALCSRADGSSRAGGGGGGGGGRPSFSKVINFESWEVSSGIAVVENVRIISI